jgi:hypothetical protein
MMINISTTVWQKPYITGSSKILLVEELIPVLLPLELVVQAG